MMEGHSCGPESCWECGEEHSCVCGNCDTKSDYVLRGSK